MKNILYLLLITILFSCNKMDETNKDTKEINDVKKTNMIRVDTVKLEDIKDVKNEFYFGGVYPKISGLENKKFEDELNNVFLKNVNDNKKEPEGLDLGIGFEIFTLNDTLISVVQEVWGRFSGTGTSCGMLGHAYTINADLKNEKILTNADLNLKEFPVNEYNKVILFYYKYISTYPFDPDNDFADNNIPTVQSTDELIKICFAIRNDSLIVVEYAMPSACVSKGVYQIPVKSIHSNNINLPDVKVMFSDMASNLVKTWIEALGKREFERAYELMSGSTSYELFASTKRYGGITNTKVHSVETVSSSGCNYVVVASYDSFDPSNRDGKFTERFNVSNCYNIWQITGIKNISTEYYR